MSLTNLKYTSNYASGLRFITSTTFTAASSVSIDGCFSADYQHYLIMRDLLGSSALANLNVQLRAAGSTATAANYRQQYLSVSGGSVVGGRVTGMSQWFYGLGYTENPSYGFSRTWISNPFEAVRTTAWSDHTYAANEPNMQSVVYEHDLATSYDGFTVNVVGATNMTGSIYVYGLKETP
jgi:hypothetical protein